MKGLLKTKSFTIIELVMVILIISIIAVALFMAVISTGPNSLDAATRRLVSDLKYARQLAISRQVPSGVSMNPAGNSYFVYIEDDSTIPTTKDPALDPYTRKDHSIDYDQDTEYKGVNLLETNLGDDVSFDYMGVPRNSSGTNLSSQGSIKLLQGGQSRTITIEQNTGRISFQ